MSWTGVVGASGEHYELATRAWCHRDNTYCYEHALCTCCMAASERYEVCFHCNGEGYVEVADAPSNNNRKETEMTPERASRAYRYAHLYAREINDNDDIESAITGLIADLGHLAEEFYGIGGTDALLIGMIRYGAEQEGEQ